jgi:hypothetical protein
MLLGTEKVGNYLVAEWKNFLKQEIMEKDFNIRNNIVCNNYLSMKKHLALLLLLLFNLITHSQELCGRYYHGDYYMNFENHYAEFVTLSDGCLIFELSGQGKFEIIDDYLLIYTELHSSPNSEYIATKNNNDYSSITVLGVGGFSVPNAKIKLLDSNKMVIGETETDWHGKTIIKNNPAIKYIHVSYIGTNSIIIEFDKTMDYEIVLGESVSIENRIAVFKISDKTESEIALTLLTTSFEVKQDKVKELRRLENSAMKDNPIERVYRK